MGCECCTPIGYLWGIGEGVWLPVGLFYPGTQLGLGKLPLGFPQGGAGFTGARSTPLLPGLGGSSVPKQSDWVFFSPGHERSYGILADGSLWGWGTGPIGDGTLNSYSRPRKIGTDQWKFVSHSSTHTLGIKQDDSVWYWDATPGFLTHPRVFLSSGIERVDFDSQEYSIGNSDLGLIEIVKNSPSDPGSGAKLEFLYECRITKLADVLNDFYTLSSQGSGYKSEPTVMVRLQGETKEIRPLSVDIGMEYIVQSVAVNSGGTGYSSGCRAIFSKGIDGDTAEGSVTVSNSSVQSIQITKPGKYASPPTLSIKRETNLTALVEPVMNAAGGVQSVNVVYGGRGYPFNSQVKFSKGIETAEADATFSEGVLTNVNVTKQGKYKSPPKVEIVRAEQVDADLSVVVSGKVSSTKIVDGGAYTGRNVTLAFQGGEPSIAAEFAAPPAFDTVILGVEVKESGQGYTSRHRNPIGVRMGPTAKHPNGFPIGGYLGRTILSPSGVVAISANGAYGGPADEGAWDLPDGLVEPFEFSFGRQDEFPGYYLPSIGVTPTVKIYEYGRQQPVSMTVTYDTAAIQPSVPGKPYLRALRWKAKLDAAVTGVKSPVMIRIDFPQMNVESITQPLTPPTTTNTGTGGAGGGLTGGGQTGGQQTQLVPSGPGQDRKWQVRPKIDSCKLANSGFTSVVDSGDLCVVTEQLKSTKAGSSKCGPQGLPVFYGGQRDTGTGEFWPDFARCQTLTLPARSLLLRLDEVMPGFQEPEYQYATAYPAMTTFVIPEATGDGCEVKATLEDGKCNYKIDKAGEGYRTEPQVTATSAVLSPSKVTTNDTITVVAAANGVSYGLNNKGEPLVWPAYGHTSPQKVGWSIRIRHAETVDAGKSSTWRHSTPENLDKIVADGIRTPAGYPMRVDWDEPIGFSENSYRTHFGTPRLQYNCFFYNLDPVVKIDGGTGFADPDSPEYVYENGGLTAWIPGGIYEYVYCPTSPQYEPGYVFGTVDPIGYQVRASCFTKAPDLGEDLTVELISPGECTDIYYEGGKVYAVSKSNEIWILTEEGEFAPYIGQPGCQKAYEEEPEKRILHFHRTKFDAKWEWELEEESKSVDIYVRADWSKVPNQWGQTFVESFEPEPLPTKGTISNTSYKGPPSPTVSNAECGWGTEVEVYPHRSYSVVITKGGSGYCPGDDVVLRISGGKTVSASENQYSHGTVSITTKTFRDDYFSWTGGVWPGIVTEPVDDEGEEQSGGYLKPPGLCSDRELPDRINLYGSSGPGYLGNPSFRYAWSWLRSTVGVFQGKMPPVRAITSIEWKGAVEESKPLYSDYPTKDIGGLQIAGGSVVGPARVLGTGLVEISAPSGSSFFTLPTVSVVSKSGSGSGAEAVLVPSVVAQRQKYPRCLTKLSAKGVVSATRNQAVTADGKLARLTPPNEPLPNSYSHDYQSARSISLMTKSGYLYEESESDITRPFAVPNLTALVTNGGSGYTLPPRITVTQPTDDIAVVDCKFDGKVVSLGVDNGGHGYTSPPTLTIDKGAQAEAVISGPVSAFDFTNRGKGYAAPPVVTLEGPGLPAEVTCVLDEAGSISDVLIADGGKYREAPTVKFSQVSQLVSAKVDKGGEGYTSPPQVVVVSDSGGSGATAVALVAYQVSSIAVNSGGKDYTSAPEVVFSGGDGCGAAATATIDAETKQVTSIDITNGGEYRSRPSVKLVGGGGTGAEASAFISGPVSDVIVTRGGRDYVDAPTILFVGGGGKGAEATATIGTPFANSVASIAVSEPGAGYRSNPIVEIVGSGSGALAVAKISAAVESITLTNSGYGYRSPPNIKITGDGSGATAVAKIRSGSVTEIEVQNPGSGYTRPPIVEFSGGSGVGASAFATIAGPVSEVTVTSPGRGYLSPPKILISQGGGCGAKATATLSSDGEEAEATCKINGSILYARVTQPGSGYEYSPTVTISGGGNYVIADLDDRLGKNQIAQEAYDEQVAAARGKIQARIEGTVEGLEITKAGKHYATEYVSDGSQWPTWRPVGVGFGLDDINAATENRYYKLGVDSKSCSGGGVAQGADFPSGLTFYQKPVIAMWDSGVTLEVESVRGSWSTSNGLRADPPTVTGWLRDGDLTVTTPADQKFVWYEDRYWMTDLKGMRVGGRSANRQYHDKFVQASYDGQTTWLADVPLSKNPPPVISLFDETGTGAKVQVQSGTGTISGGTGYTNAAYLQIVDAKLEFKQCEATCVVTTSGEIESITIGDQGNGYLNPVVIVHDGRGEGCKAEAVLEDGYLPRKIKEIFVTDPGSGYSQADPPQVYVAESGPPFVKSDLCKAFNEAWKSYGIRVYEQSTPEYYKPFEPIFRMGTDYGYGNLIRAVRDPITGQIIHDQFATFETVETLKTKWGNRIYEPYSEAPNVTVEGTCDTPLTITVSAVTWTAHFARNKNVAGIR